MGRKTWKFICLLDAGRVILGDKRGFGKDSEFYDKLYQDLKKDWKRSPATDKSVAFAVGQHVLVNSILCEGPRRGFIHDVTNSQTTRGENTYLVYLYDEGVMEEVEFSHVKVLGNDCKTRLEPRTVMVRLTGMAPAKVVKNLNAVAKEGSDESALVLIQDSNWSSRANRLVTEWLKNEDLRYLGVKHDKTNDDGTVYGDVFRKLRSRAFACTNENENTPESEGNEKKSEDKLKTKEKFYLSEYILSMHFGMRNEDLTCSQLKIRVTPSGTPKVTDVSANTKAGSSCTSLTTPTSMSKAAPATPTPPQTEEIGPENMALCQDFKPAVVQDDAYCGKDKQGMLLQSFNAMVDEAVVDEEKELAYAKNDSDDDFDFADGFDFRMQLDDMLQSIGMTKTQVVDKFRELNHNAGFAALPLTPPSLQIAPPQPVIQKIPPQPIIQKIPPQPIIQKTPPQPIILKAPPPPQPTQPQLIFLKAPPQPVIQKTPPQPTIQDTSPKPSTSAAFSKPSPEKYQLTVSSIWRQTDQSFILTIQLPDIKKYELKVLEDKNNVEFRTMDKTPNYGFKIKLFGKVDQEYSTHLTGQYMRVTFTKRMVGHKWPRALHDRNEKLKWLKQDIEQSFEDEEENAELNERMKLLEVSAAANALADDEYDVDQGMMLFSASESEAEEDF